MRKVFTVSETNKPHCSKEQICHNKKNLSQQTEQRFNKPATNGNYTIFFKYYNAIKNRSIPGQLNIQEQ